MRPAARIAILTALLASAACGEAPGDAPANDGARLYVIANCTACHGKDGKGGPLGPPLRGLEENWTRETLAAYLADPKGTIEKDPRLKAQGNQFRMPMPPVTLPLEDRLTLADHALALSAAGR